MGKETITNSKIGLTFKRKLGLTYSAVGFKYLREKPDDAIGIKKPGNGCIMPLILKSGRGKTVAFDEHTTGWPCSRFYLGYSDRIFDGVEYFLSHGMLMGRRCERFVKTPSMARRYLKSIKFKEKATGVATFRPLENYPDGDEPELVIFFANADQLSALILLLYFSRPEEDCRVVSRFASACASIVTLPLQYTQRGDKKAVWGMHDISARTKLPHNIMSLSFPYSMVLEMYKNINESFLRTSTWKTILHRIQSAKSQSNNFINESVVKK